MFLGNNESKNNAILFIVAFTLILAYSLRSFFGTLAIVSVRERTNDWLTLQHLLAGTASITFFESMMLLFNFICVIIVVFIIPSLIKKYRRA